MSTSDHRIIIIGAGPTGLGAAYRLSEIDGADWAIYEANSYPGGLAASFQDDKGFTWDLGGHVMFSHFDYYDRAYDRVMGDNYYEHWRESYIWVLNRFVQYPFQNHLRGLPEDAALECLMGLIEAFCRRSTKESVSNFKEWILAQFGKGIAEHFMLPYNSKVWAYPLDRMAFDWIAERVSVVDLESTLSSLLKNDTDYSWGPNERFRFPKRGGTGDLWRRVSQALDRPVQYLKKAVAVDLDKHRVTFADGETIRYEYMISSMPLDQLVAISKPMPEEVKAAASNLIANRVYVVGVGMKGSCPSSKNWIYFPEPDLPFYRVTYLSNYSPAVCPSEGGPYHSLLCETACSIHKNKPFEQIVEETLRGLIHSKIIDSEDQARIISTQIYDVPKAYPVPTLGLNDASATCQFYFEAKQILSRGRFGAWKYMVGNMDHSFMQGVEAVQRILFGKKETVIEGTP